MDKKAMKAIAGTGITVEQFGRAMRRLGSSPAFREFYAWYTEMCQQTLPKYMLLGRPKPVWMRIRDWWISIFDRKQLQLFLAFVWLLWLGWMLTAIMTWVWE